SMPSSYISAKVAASTSGMAMAMTSPYRQPIDTNETTSTMMRASPGVEKAVIIGDQPEKIYIDVSSKALAERGLTIL
ncbi:hypothetical protein ACC696_38930, partial [Rhizobium ruizarguesonis]